MSVLSKPGPHNHICDVSGIAVGHAHAARVGTGASVVLPAARAVAAVDSRGGGPGTRETDALAPDTLVDAVDAIVLSGGSSYGLAAASGVTDWLGARGRGFGLEEAAPVAPVVPAAILYDLTNGGDKSWGETSPYDSLGRAAVAAAAHSPSDYSLGTLGAGYGAQAGRLKGGLGSASTVTDGGLQVAALMAVNSFGAVVMPGTACFWAWPFERNREFGGRGAPADFDLGPDLWRGTKNHSVPGQNTTIGVVATNAALTPAQARRVAVMAQDGMARSIRPVHSPLDGDTLFVLATGVKALDAPEFMALTHLGALAADCVARAIARAVFEARSLFRMQAYGDLS